MVNCAAIDDEDLRITATEDERTVLPLTGQLTIRVADQTKDLLREYLSRETNPAFDLSGIEKCDTAGLQILSSACRTAEALGKRVSFTAPSEAVRNAAAALGFPAWWAEEKRASETQEEEGAK